MSGQSRRILRTLDEPARVLFWPIDEFLTLATPMIVGLILGSVVLSISGWPLLLGYRRFRRRFAKGRARALIYWHMPPNLAKKAGFDAFPPSHFRELL